MISFIYDEQYTTSNFNADKRKAEGIIKKYFLENFGNYAELNLKLIFLPNSEFEVLRCVASANPFEMSIKFNFDTFCIYLLNLKPRQGKLIMADIKKKKDFQYYMFNCLHHEMQHIINNIEYHEAFAYINSIDSCDYVKLGISNLLDEYKASYSAQKKFFNKSGYADGGLEWLCGKNNMIITASSEAEKITLYNNIRDGLSYAIAECKVLSETKGINDKFDNILGNENVADFKDIFANIRLLLENFSANKYKEYTVACEDEIKKFITVLHIDIESLKKIHS
ncbi:hypothetical protein LGK97_13805 [Clostridium sp. CS001]|uniref:hypothetical protein n=1 Tax=Clostridium sp. CS001 TaxID=2880648 RepID=UPI001CF2B4AB|nr:hypothetical protein [Clostridium sp. CS001]MCB2290816.1 hypothetical protein [Clostridium sp. CS001]